MQKVYLFSIKFYSFLKLISSWRKIENYKDFSFIYKVYFTYILHIKYI